MADYKAKQFPKKADAERFVRSNNIKEFIMEGVLENGEYMLRYKMPDSKVKNVKLMVKCRTSINTMRLNVQRL